MLCLVVAHRRHPLDHRRRAALLGLDRGRPQGHIAAMLIRDRTDAQPGDPQIPARPDGDGGRHAATFPMRQAAEASPLAEALFATGMVEGVFFGRDFISVTAAAGRRLGRARAAKCSSILLDHFVSGAPLVHAGHRRRHPRRRATPAFDDDPADADIIDQIKELIETRVRPGRGPGRRRHRLSRVTRTARSISAMQGACSGCPSSAITLKRGIESLIRHYVPEVETVEAV